MLALILLLLVSTTLFADARPAVAQALQRLSSLAVYDAGGKRAGFILDTAASVAFRVDRNVFVHSWSRPRPRVRSFRRWQ